MTDLTLSWLLYGGAVGLIVIGIGGMVLSRHLFRIILALVIAEAGANLLLVLSGYRLDAIAPIITAEFVRGTSMVDPIPQALVLTAIVIGVGIQALALSLAIKVYHGYGTLDMRSVFHKMRSDIDKAANLTPTDSHEGPLGERPLPGPHDSDIHGDKDKGTAS